MSAPPGRGTSCNRASRMAGHPGRRTQGDPKTTARPEWPRSRRRLEESTALPIAGPTTGTQDAPADLLRGGTSTRPSGGGGRDARGGDLDGAIVVGPEAAVAAHTSPRPPLRRWHDPRRGPARGGPGSGRRGRTARRRGGGRAMDAPGREIRRWQGRKSTCGAPGGSAYEPSAEARKRTGAGARPTIAWMPSATASLGPATVGPGNAGPDAVIGPGRMRRTTPVLPRTPAWPVGAGAGCSDGKPDRHRRQTRPAWTVGDRAGAPLCFA